jgi:hypothetical protein
VIYTSNCDPNYISAASYSFAEPKLVDASRYYTGTPPVYNTAYTPVDWNNIYTHPYSGASYGTLNNKYLTESSGLAETFTSRYSSAQKTVFGHSNAAGTGRIADTGFLYIPPGAPVWMDFNGDTSSAPSAEEIKNLGIDGCQSSPSDFFEPGVLADTLHLNFILGTPGGTIEELSDHADESLTVQDQTYVQAAQNGFFEQPINTAGHISKFNKGSTLPAKIKIYADIDPSPDVANLVAVEGATDFWFKAVKVSTSTSCDLTEGCDTEVGTTATPTTGTFYKWDPNAKHYVYNWKTLKSDSGLFRIYIGQGSVTLQSVEIILA